jgi:hypothetical protein
MRDKILAIKTETENGQKVYSGGVAYRHKKQTYKYEWHYQTRKKRESAMKDARSILARETT